MPESRVAEVSKGDATEATAPEPAPAPATPLQQKGFGAAGVPHADHKRDDHECVCLACRSTCFKTSSTRRETLPR